MNLLLDTYLLLWSAHDPKRLTKGAHGLIENPQNELLLVP
jgi:PIN domain nuclease of toxin-antitoxin system